MDNKINFIIHAIQDCQATIRATDVKVGALLTGLLVPFSQISQIIKQLETVSSQLNSPILSVIFFFIWGLGIWSLIRTISAIDNPSNHISNENICKGSFYSGGLYSFSLLDSMWNRASVKANKNISNFNLEYPVSKDDIAIELSFEHMKLVYIRDIKLYRLNFALRISVIWFILGLSVILLNN